MFARPQHAKAVMTITIELEHCVDYVLEHSWPSERAFLGDVTDEQDGRTRPLSVLDERVGALAHLRHRAGSRGEDGVMERLHGVDHDEVRLDFIEVANNVG